MSQKDVKIHIGTEADTKGAKAAKDALEAVQYAAGMPGLMSFAEESEDAADAADILADATKEEAEEFQKLKNMVDLSKAAIESFKKVISSGNNSKGMQAGLADSENTLAQENAALEALRKKIALRVQATKATQQEAEATRKLAQETKAAATVEKEREQQRRIADQQRRADERAEDQAGNVRRIKQNQIAQGIAFAAQQAAGATQTLRQLSESAKSLDEGLANNLGNLANGFGSLQQGIQGAASGWTAGGPAGAIVGGITGLAAPWLKEALDELGISLETLGEATAIQADMPARIEAIKKAMNMEKAAESWKALADAMDLVDQKLSSQSRIRASADALDVTKANEAVRQAELSGGDVTAAKEAAIAAKRKAEQNANLRAVSDAVNEVSGIQTRIQGKENQISAAERSGATADEIRALNDELQKLRKALEVANIKAEETRSLASHKAESSALTNANDDAQRLKDAGQQAGDKITQALETILRDMGEAANDPRVQEKADSIRTMLEDGFQKGEQDQIALLLAQIAGETRAGWQAQHKAVKEGQDVMKDALGLIKDVADGYKALKSEVKSLQGKVRSNMGTPNY